MKLLEVFRFFGRVMVVSNHVGMKTIALNTADILRADVRILKGCRNVNWFGIANCILLTGIACEGGNVANSTCRID